MKIPFSKLEPFSLLESILRLKPLPINDFGNINPVQWTRTTYFDEAVFMQNNQQVTAFYDYDSKLVGTTMKSSFDKLPAIAQKEIKEKYKILMKRILIILILMKRILVLLISLQKSILNSKN